MEALVGGVAWLLESSTSAAWFPNVQVPFFSGSSDPIGILSGLGPSLSPNATIILPSSPQWRPLTLRPTSPRNEPPFHAVVEVSTETDVQLTIEFANRHDVPFLAVTGTHGTTSTIGRMPQGIQINMRKMNSFRLNEEGDTVTVGGGIMQHELVPALYDVGKQTVTGICGCVSAIGPLLGGGHGVLQGQYGLAVDNLVSARMILADGTPVNVSETSNPDLWWAIRGAGHNFGIVTEFELKAHDLPENGDWTMFDFIFGQDKLEEAFKIVNKLTDAAKNHPDELVEWGAFVRIPEIDSSNPVVAYTVMYQGSESAGDRFAAPFRDLGPIVSNVRPHIPYKGVTAAAGFAHDDPGRPCSKGANLDVYPSSVTRYNPAAMRSAFDVFANLTADPRFATGVFLLESYSMRAVKAVDEKSTAVPPEERHRNILMAPIFWWDEESVESEALSFKAGKEITRIITEGLSEPDEGFHAYLNYANGDESLEAIYGHSEWRIEKLRKAKRKWDPHNRFGFYNAIV